MQRTEAQRSRERGFVSGARSLFTVCMDSMQPVTLRREDE